MDLEFMLDNITEDVTEGVKEWGPGRLVKYH